MLEKKLNKQQLETLDLIANSWDMLSDEEKGRLKGYGEALADTREEYERRLKEFKEKVANIEVA